MKSLHYATFLLLAIGGINWGLIGFFEFDLVAYLLGNMSMLSRIVYALVGVSVIIEVAIHPKTCKMCSK